MGDAAAAAAGATPADGVSQALAVVLFSLGVAVAIEALSWVLVYRTDAYRRAAGELDRAAKRLEAARASDGAGASSSGGGGGAAADRGAKQRKKLEEAAKAAAAAFNGTKWKANIAMMLVNVAAVRHVTSAYDGVAVARLPFTPPTFIANLFTHRGLPGSDLTEASALFLYLAAALFWRANLAALGGWGPGRAAERLMRPQPQPIDESKYK